jgi:hypothetical protein
MWFGSIVRMPIDVNSQMSLRSPTGREMEEEAKEFILPSPTLRPSQRIQIYCQQYWWRLLNTLHEIFPYLVRLFGYSEFNQKIGIPYLEKFPPHDWSLNTLGDLLPIWVEKNYQGPDKSLIFDVARIDWAYNDAFLAPQNSPLQTNLEPEKIFQKVIHLQPHVHLFSLHSDLFSLREEFLKQEPDYWLHHDFPKNGRKGEVFFVLYRDVRNDVVYKEIAKTEFVLLNRIQKGSSLKDICAWVESDGHEYIEEVASNLNVWIKNWMGDKILQER